MTLNQRLREFFETTTSPITVTSLAVIWRVSGSSLRKELNKLVAEGYLQRRKGRHQRRFGAHRATWDFDYTRKPQDGSDSTTVSQ
jgi:Fic family protein